MSTQASGKEKTPLTHGLTVKKSEDFSEWYNQVVQKAELADHAPIHGFMVIRPNAYALWENIQHFFNAIIEKRGVRNAYFPLLIPESFFKKEAEHFEGLKPRSRGSNEKMTRKSASPFARRAKPSCITRSRSGFVRIAICRCVLISGATCSVGKSSKPNYFCARASFCGKKDIARMPPTKSVEKKPWR